MSRAWADVAEPWDDPHWPEPDDPIWPPDHVEDCDPFDWLNAASQPVLVPASILPEGRP